MNEMENIEFITPEFIREVFLSKLAGNLISPREKSYLKQAESDPQLNAMCRELKDIYDSREMLELLRARPNSQRFAELVQKAIEREEHSESGLQNYIATWKLKYVRFREWLSKMILYDPARINE